MVSYVSKAQRIDNPISGFAALFLQMIAAMLTALGVYQLNIVVFSWYLNKVQTPGIMF